MEAEDTQRGSAVYAGLKGQILRHEFLMGTPLREEDVAGWFGTSRVPARDALRRLEQEGLVERVGRKYTIRSYSYDEIVIIYRLRSALEHLAVEHAVARLGSGENDELEKVATILDQQHEAIEQTSRGEFSELDVAFHLAIADISGLPLLSRELELSLNRARLIRSNEISRDSGPRGAYEDHCRIFAALQRGDAATAKAELDYHYMTTLRLHAGASANSHPQDAS
ncbi:GntR family transcriptional regulator [Amorphus sp. 3PC139-8]|uniref:GntR family transcriptional regulator n=1 Tax=Amorphus sp. 3PC139-8 TaxID=2735676 RepID=UPI00345DA0C9